MPTVNDSVEDELPTGLETMSPAMAEMKAYARYLYDQAAQGLGDRVWEIGVGYGTYTRWLREAGKTVLATDIDAGCVDAVARHFQGDRSVVTGRVDLRDQQSVSAHQSFQADSILCLNVLEHIEDDVSALRWLRESAAPEAGLGLIVPAHPWLFGRMDQEAGHFRRYTRRTLARALEQAGWVVERLRYLNVTGAAGWWYHNRWRRQAGLADKTVNRQMRGADAWLPRLARVTDPVFGFWAGLSVLAIAHAGRLDNPENPLAANQGGKSA